MTKTQADTRVVHVVEEVLLAVDAAAGRAQGFIDLPKVGECASGGKVTIVGWALGNSSRAVAIELVGDDGAERVSISHERPDIARAFPGDPDAATSGFRHTLGLGSDADLVTVLVQVVLADDTRVELGTIALERRMVEERAVTLDPESLLPVPSGEYDLTAEEALARLKSSPAVYWAHGIDEEPPSGSAWNRICSDSFFTPLIRPEFGISADDRVFAIGSCFARGVEAALTHRGLAVESRTHAFDDIPMRVIGSPIDFANKYTPHAIRDELRRALEPDETFPEEALVQLPDGTWQDPHATSNFEFSDFDTVMTRRSMLVDLFRKVRDCRVIIVTLGLIETFFDTETGLYTNSTPHLTAEPDRFRFRILTYDEVIDALEEIRHLLMTYGKPESEIVVTVSPVPLGATFTGTDVVLANTYSKSLLRTAAGHWAVEHANVHYFPSYEMVMNSDRKAVWRKDGRHVQDEFVRRIMDLFVRTHVS